MTAESNFCLGRRIVGKDGKREGFHDLRVPVTFSVTHINHVKHKEQLDGVGSSLSALLPPSLTVGSSLSALLPPSLTVGSSLSALVPPSLTVGSSLSALVPPSLTVGSSLSALVPPSHMVISLLSWGWFLFLSVLVPPSSWVLCAVAAAPCR